MKKIFFVLALFFSATTFSQVVLPLTADSVRTKGELVIRNNTQSIKGMLVNLGGGVTVWKKIEKLNDSTLVFNEDTVVIRGTAGGSVETATNIGGGAAIYKTKSGTQFQFKTIVSDSSLAIDVTDSTVRIVVDPGIMSSVQRLKDSLANLRSSITGGGVSAEFVNNLISVALSTLPINFDDVDFIGNGSPSQEWKVNPNRVALKINIDSIRVRIDSIVNNWPSGGGPGGRTRIVHASNIGDSIIVKINDSTYRALKLRNGTNVTFSVNDSTLTINALPGTAEINSKTLSSSGTVSYTIPADSRLEAIYVKPVSNLAGLKVGTVADDDLFSQVAIPIIADADPVELAISGYFATATAIQFSGITASTQIKIIYKPLHE